MRSLWKSRQIIVVILCLGIAAALVFVAGQDGRRAQWLSAPPPPQKWRFASLGNWTEPIRVRLSSFEQRLLGPPKLVYAEGEVFDLDPYATFPGLPAPTLALTNELGARVLVFPDRHAFEQQLKNSPGVQGRSNSRLITANGILGRMASYQRMPTGFGTNAVVQNVGWSLDILPYASSVSIDVSCFLVGTELALPPVEAFLRTNVAIGVRAKIPTNGCLFLIASGTNQNGKITGAKLSAMLLAR